MINVFFKIEKPTPTKFLMARLAHRTAPRARLQLKLERQQGASHGSRAPWPGRRLRGVDGDVLKGGNTATNQQAKLTWRR